MALPSAKDLKKLAKTCRDLGIKTFKSGDFEFTLGEEPQPRVAKSASKQTETQPDTIESDTLEGDALLFWSAVDTSEDTTNTIGA